MTKGKYGARADARFRALETQAVLEAKAKIADLTHQLAKAQHDLYSAQTEIDSRAMAIAGRIDAEEKKDLTQRITDLETQASEERVRLALQVWEMMHRTRFRCPAPLQLPVMHDDEVSSDELRASLEYWEATHWDIASLLCKDYDEIWEFFRVVEGHGWRLAGHTVGGESGQPAVRQSAREAQRWMRKGRLRVALMDKVHYMRAYYERVWLSRKSALAHPDSAEVEPFVAFGDANPLNASWQDRRDEMIEKMREHE